MAEYAEYNHAASTGQHLVRWSSMSETPCLVEPQALFMPSKSSSESVKGHPLTSDCSGNAGIVAAA